MPHKLEKIPNNCLHIKYELDKEYLERVAYTLPRKKFFYKGKEVWGYHYAPWNNSVIEKEIKNNFNLRGRFNIKFIFLRPTTYLDWHVDKGTKSAVIWKLFGNDTIEYREGSYHYDMAIFDTSKEHRVAPLASERVLLKLSCFDMSYEELAGGFAKKYMYYEPKN